MTPHRPQNTPIKFMAPQPLKTQLAHLAQSRNVSMAALIRLILTEYLKQKGAR